VPRQRLRRADCSGPGLRRIKRGRGFVYLDENGQRIENPETVDRIRDLAIPPAWADVWICSDPMGHLQATGIDAAGRKQYLYHDLWRDRRDREKFRRMLRFARVLPRVRRRYTADVRSPDPTRERVLGCAVRLLDLGLFRVGSEQYADDEGGIGLATLQKQHVVFRNGSMVFDYPAKGGLRRVQEIADPECSELIRSLKRRRDGNPDLLAYRNGRRWVSVRSDDINDYLKQHAGEEFSAKDFRTWHATVLAAVTVAAIERSGTKTGRKRTIDTAVRRVAEMLGNTPAVARRAYIDPRVFDRYQAGHTIADSVARAADADKLTDRTRARLERAVIELLEDAGD
jgi:DNA topoisomerase IB